MVNLELIVLVLARTGKNAAGLTLTDIGLISGTIDTSDVHVIPWREDTLVVAMAANDPLAMQVKLKFQDMLERPFISVQKDSALLALCRDQARILGKRLIERAKLQALLVSKGWWLWDLVWQ
jgi:hypothetical protein